MPRGGSKSGQKYQNLGHLQTAISHARNKLLTNFQRQQSTTRHGHMVYVQKSDMGMTKNGATRLTKVAQNFALLPHFLTFHFVAYFDTPHVRV